MSNTRKIARKIFYTGECDLLPSEEEERELNVRYGMKFPYKNKFNSLVSDYTSEESEEKPQSTMFYNPFPPIARTAIARIVDEIEDDYNLDVDNLDPKKYRRLEPRLDDVKKHVWRKIMLSKIPEAIKQDLGRGVERAQSVRALLSYLLLKTSKL